MKAFAQLFQALDATTSQSAKLAALVAYLRVAPPADAAWATYFLAGGKPRQMVPTKRPVLLCERAGTMPTQSRKNADSSFFITYISYS